MTWNSTFKPSAKPMKRSPMKARARKSSPIRKSAQGEPCMLMLPGVCNGNPETVVWAHSNRSCHGKGMGLKAKDEYGCYACSSCHAVLDGQAPRPAGLTKDDVETYFDIAMTISRDILRDKGLLKDDE